MAQNSMRGVELANSREEIGADWRGKAVAILHSLRVLKKNWNSYGARPIDPAILSAAEDFLNRLSSLDLLSPSIVPTTQGGVQLEWHDRGVDLEIELLSPDKYRLSFDDSATGQEENVEGPLCESAGIEPFLAKVKREA
jgi:hypothetical protein